MSVADEVAQLRRERDNTKNELCWKGLWTHARISGGGGRGWGASRRRDSG